MEKIELQKSNCDQSQRLKLGQNSKTQTVTKLKNSDCGKTFKNIKVGQNS